MNGRIVREIAIWLFQIITVLAIAYTFVHFFGQRMQYVGASMAPTINNDDMILVNRFIYLVSKPKRYDLVVFKPKGNENSHIYISRVIGLPGETLQIIDGVVTIDGTPLEGSYAAVESENAGIAREPVTLGTNEYFVLGDDRENTDDSRNADVGIVKLSYISGKPWLRANSIKTLEWIK